MSINRRTFLKDSTTIAAGGLIGLTSFGRLSFAGSQGGGQLIDSTPAADGYRMPGEFEPHEAIWLVWPESTEWRFDGKIAEKVIAELATAIAGDIKVRLAASRKQAARVRSLVPDNVEVVEINAGTGWVRDDGPTFVINDKGDRRGVDWEFNEWGFPESYRDTSKAARRILKHEMADRYRAPLVMEGGSIHSDGQGTIITTEECLLNPNRNPDLTKLDIEENLKSYLGAKKIVWIPRGVFEDSTSGHVDNMCCFVRPGEVLLTWTDDQGDEQYDRSRQALDILEASTDANGTPFTVHKLQQPGPLFTTQEEKYSLPDGRDGEVEDRMPASYINYILTNRRVIFPLLDPEIDPIATETFARVFPDHEIIGVPGREILLHGGNFHCISQNLPLPA